MVNNRNFPQYTTSSTSSPSSRPFTVSRVHSAKMGKISEIRNRIEIQNDLCSILRSVNRSSRRFSDPAATSDAGPEGTVIERRRPLSGRPEILSIACRKRLYQQPFVSSMYGMIGLTTREKYDSEISRRAGFGEFRFSAVTTTKHSTEELNTRITTARMCTTSPGCTASRKVRESIYEGVSFRCGERKRTDSRRLSSTTLHERLEKPRSLLSTR